MVATIPERIAVITQRQEDVIKKLTEHDHVINGNGGVGLKVKLAELNSQLEVFCEKVEDMKKTIDLMARLLITFLTLLITAVLPFLVWFFVTFVPQVTAHINHTP